MKFTLKDFRRFEKQIILKKISISGQKKIKNSKILIIGMGGLGCPLLTYLASSGVYNIGIVDHDRVELSNLSRQIIFNSSDIGKFKVIQAKTKIKKIYKDIKIKTFKEKVTNKNIKRILKNYDIICDDLIIFWGCGCFVLFSGHVNGCYGHGQGPLLYLVVHGIKSKSMFKLMSGLVDFMIWCRKHWEAQEKSPSLSFMLFY